MTIARAPTYFQSTLLSEMVPLQNAFSVSLSSGEQKMLFSLTPFSPYQQHPCHA
jgi:hypothetical protein